MIANRFNPLGGDSRTPAMRYVQDGLIAHWDALENVDYGKRDANSNVWKDLISGTEMVGTDGVEWGDNFYLGQSAQWFSQGCSARQDLSESYKVGNFTIEAVLFIDNEQYPSKDYPFFFGANSNRLKLYCRSTARFGGWFRSSQYFYENRMESNPLHTVAYVINAADSIAQSYDSGVLKATINKEILPQETTSNFYIGRNAYLGGDNTSFQGRIHAIRWYDRVLSQEELQFNRTIDLERFGL